MSFTPREFRDALGLFPTGIAVVTAVGPADRLAGVTVNSFTSVSLDPPLILVSLARGIRSFDIFAAAEHFAVSLLPADQRRLSAHFASAAGDKWSGADHRLGTISCPIIEPNIVAFECRTYARHEAGDHVLLLGQVIAIDRASQAPPRPLVYFRGQYRELSEDATDPGVVRLEGW